MCFEFQHAFYVLRCLKFLVVNKSFSPHCGAKGIVMTKYLVKRLLRGILSVVVVVAIVMLLVYTFVDRENIFRDDAVYSKKQNNEKNVYMMQRWEKFGYLDYVNYSDYLYSLCKSGEISEETRVTALKIEQKAENDPEIVREYAEKFREYYESQGYTVVRLNAVKISEKKSTVATGGRQQLYAYRDYPFITRFLGFFTGMVKVDSINYVTDDIEDRGIKFTLFDPVYNTEPETGKQLKKVFSPAIIGNGTFNKYLLYFDDQFPFIHQNLFSIGLGLSFSVNRGVDVYDTMTNSQGAYIKTPHIYPTGFVEDGAEDLHTATYASINIEAQEEATEENRNANYFTDNYSNTVSHKQNKSKLGFSFVIGIISSIIAYAMAIPLGILMARKKDKLVDKLGTIYIVIIMAVPSLAYIFMFQALGRLAGLPSVFNMEENWLMYVLPILSLALPSIAGLMKWLRRYMIDQMNSDYVRFARSGGLSENEIFSKHILKNAAIPIIHGIPGSVLGSLIGAIITESVYKVPGAGGLLTNAINSYDNSVIVGLTLFYALISIISIILGDILMAMADPRISFNSKAR